MQQDLTKKNCFFVRMYSDCKIKHTMKLNFRNQIADRIDIDIDYNDH